MRIRQIDGDFTYDGTQLSSRFIKDSGLGSDDAAVAWFGAADVPTENLVDNEDREAGAVIRSARMLHLIAFLPGRSLPETAALQRLYVATLLDLIRGEGIDACREGDDIFVGAGSEKRKLSVSVATSGGDAGLIHIGLNVDATGSPVKAVGLRDLGVDERAFAARALDLVAAETEGILKAAAKVRTVE